MKLLILSCNTGEGHNSCSKAIMDYCNTQNLPTEIIDSLSFISERASGFISKWHSKIYRHSPASFSRGYEFIGHHENYFDESSFAYHVLTSGTDALFRYIMENGFHHIICTHVFTALQLTDVIKKYNPPVKTYFMATDYTYSPTCSLSNLDYYFIPHESLREEFIHCGIPAEKLICTGIPVRNTFLSETDKNNAKKKCGIPANHKHLIYMCGSMGCGPIKKITALLDNSLPGNCELTVICGKNKKLYQKLIFVYANTPRIHILGFVENMSLYMDSADLFLTKPGGLSISEAAAKKLPMVLINEVRGCETRNLNFFLKYADIRTAQTPEYIARLCADILQNDEALKQMSLSYVDCFEPLATQKIYAILQGNSA